MSAASIVSLVLLLLLSLRPQGPEAGHSSAPAPERDTPGMFLVGEELTYKVKYLFLNLGSIRVRVNDRRVVDGRERYFATAFIDSRVPLITDLHVRFDSEMDEGIFSYGWIAADSTKEGVFLRNIRFDYEGGRMFVDRGRRGESGTIIEEADTFAVTDRCQDGLSLYYYARQHVLERKEHNVPTVIDSEQVNTYINFTTEQDAVDIGAVDYDISVVGFDGRADFVGIFGLTGGFEGWFSNDAARVPIVAYMNVIVGSVKIELEAWDRPGWSPPRAGKGGP